MVEEKMRQIQFKYGATEQQQKLAELFDQRCSVYTQVFKQLQNLIKSQASLNQTIEDVRENDRLETGR